MTQTENARLFKSLHVPGSPLVLYNIWDAGSAATLAKAGAPAVATGSWSVAAAQGYTDGERLPLALLLQIAGRIAATVDIPLSVDFEGGYAADPAGLAENIRQLIATGAIGINFEDQIVGGDGLYPVAEQAARISAIRQAADATGVPLFINARTDVFLKSDAAEHDSLCAEALARAEAYASAGADGFFVPGLTDPALIGRICAATPLPVNVMMRGALTSIADVAALGVARASFGPGPYMDAMAGLATRYGSLA